MTINTRQIQLFFEPNKIFIQTNFHQVEKFKNKQS